MSKGMVKLNLTQTPLTVGETYDSANFKINTVDGIDRFVGIIRADAGFQVKLLQSHDGTNWDHEALFKPEKIGSEYQCTVHISRFGIYAKWQIINGSTAMTFLRGQINGVY